jgi:serine/threonine-protein kinase
VRGENVDARTDVYGLGCFAYFLLTGTVLFNKPNAMSIALAHLTEQPEPPSMRSELAIPESLETVLMACVAKRPEERPQSIPEFRAMLDNCLDVPPWTAADANRWWALHRPEPAQKVS